MIEDAQALMRFSSLTSQRHLVPHAFACALALGGLDARDARQRDRLRDVVLPAARLIATRQAHTSRVLDVTESAAGEPTESAEPFDGLVTAGPRQLLLAYSADCPILYLVGDPLRAVGLFHCGWKGLAAGMVQAAVAAMGRLGVRPEQLVAAISPGAGVCCYEVGEEVVAQITAQGVAREAVTRPFRIRNGSPTVTIDLKHAIAELLRRAGVAAARIEVAPHCSICGGERFHSYRRGGAGGAHMAAVIGLPDGGLPPPPRVERPASSS